MVSAQFNHSAPDIIARESTSRLADVGLIFSVRILPKTLEMVFKDLVFTTCNKNSV